MRDVLILDAVRTPRGKAKESGALHSLTPVELLAQLYHALERRTGLQPPTVDDVILGCSTQVGPQGANIARISALCAGWGDTVAGATVNRFCASGLDAIGQATARIRAGMDDLIVAGGIEMLSHVPMFADDGAWFSDPEVRSRTGFIHMGLAADLLASMGGLKRDALDRYALRSHHRAATARDRGRFSPSLVPVQDDDGKVLLDRDELVRNDIDLEKLGALAPLFASQEAADQRLLARYPELPRIEHHHHIGTSPALADGASLLLLGSAEQAECLGRQPRGRVRSVGHVGVDPVLMLAGNVPATEKALQRAHLEMRDVDVFEVNESFAAVPLCFQRVWDIGDDRLNPNGGAIAMGHPLGATGGVLVCSLLDELERREQAIGVASICGGAGLATALVIDRKL